MRILRLLGRYENFPETPHGIFEFSYEISTKDLQRAILQAIYGLNKEWRNAKFSSDPSLLGCRVFFDFGVADGLTFNYLNAEIMNHSLEAASRDTMPILDFICIARYYKKVGKRVYKPLKFDYYILRFRLYEKDGDLQIFHEKGTRRLSIEDLAALIFHKINRELTRIKLSKITVEMEKPSSFPDSIC